MPSCYRVLDALEKAPKPSPQGYTWFTSSPPVMSSFHDLVQWLLVRLWIRLRVGRAGLLCPFPSLPCLLLPRRASPSVRRVVAFAGVEADWLDLALEILEPSLIRALIKLSPAMAFQLFAKGAGDPQRLTTRVTRFVASPSRASPDQRGTRRCPPSAPPAV
jgi:hypothetical protein